MTAASKAEQCLRDHLRDGTWKRCDHVKRAGAAAAIGRDALKAAAAALCQRDVDSGRHAYWRIPVAPHAAWFSPVVEGREATP